MMACCHDHSGNSSERLSLRGQGSGWSVPCLIRSRKALTFYTRLVFTLTIFTGFGVIFASIWFMLDCRQKFNSIQALIPKHSSFCTNLGMQALFACCVLLFTIFGLGCIGRRMTGHAILIISGVAIFQGTMTLIFYQCRAMADDNIFKAVNETLKSCSVGTGAPFASSSSDAVSLPVNKRTFHKSSQDSAGVQSHTKSLETTFNKELSDITKEDPASPSSVEDKPGTPIVNSSWQNVNHFLKDLKRKLKDSIEVGDAESEQRTTSTASTLPPKTVDCHENSDYFISLSRNRQKKHVKVCQKVCKTYESFCFKSIIARENRGKGGIELRDSGAVYVQLMTDFGLDISDARHDYNKMTEFDKDALSCGDKLSRYIRHFCIYDNRIFTPLSLGTPIFYIFMSFCFIYLAHCDRHIKDDDIFEPKHLRSMSTSSSKSSRHSIASKGNDAEALGFQSSSTGRTRWQETKLIPSPALSDTSSGWGESELGRNLLYRETEIPHRLSPNCGSARTLETFLGDD